MSDPRRMKTNCAKRVDDGGRPLNVTLVRINHQLTLREVAALFVASNLDIFLELNGKDLRRLPKSVKGKAAKSDYQGAILPMVIDVITRNGIDGSMHKLQEYDLDGVVEDIYSVFCSRWPKLAVPYR